MGSSSSAPRSEPGRPEPGRHHASRSRTLVARCLYPAYLTACNGKGRAVHPGCPMGIMCSAEHTIGKTYHMESKALEDGPPARDRRRLSNEIKESLRELTIQLALLNHQVVAHLDFKDGDLPCLDIISRHGPLSPSELARR